MPEHAQGFVYVLDATGKTKQGWPLQMGEVQAQASTCTPHVAHVEKIIQGYVINGKQRKRVGNKRIENHRGWARI